MSQNQQQRRGRRPPISSGRGRRPPISSGQPQQQQQPQQRGGGSRNNRSRGRGRGGGNQRYVAPNQPQQPQNYGYQQNQAQNVSQAPAVNQQQMGGRKQRKAPIKSQQNQQIFEQFSQPQQQAQVQQTQQQPVQQQQPQQQQQAQSQQAVVEQNREEEKQTIEQTTAGGPQNVNQPQQQQQQQQPSPKKIKPQQRNNRQPPWIEFTGTDKLAPKRCGWAHRVRQVLSADTLRVALLKPRKSDPLLPPEIIQITLEGISAPRTQKYDKEKAEAQAKQDKRNEKKDKKKRKQKEKEKQKETERKEKEKGQEDKKDDKDKKDRKSGDKSSSPQKKGGKKEQTEKKEKDTGDKSDKSKPKKGGKKKDNETQQQQFGYRALEEDEPFAYDAREFVRKKVMNKNVFYAVWRVNSNQTLSNKAPLRYWGDIYFIENNQTKSLTKELVAAGFAEVRKNPAQLTDKEYDSLMKKQKAAQAEKKNIWSYGDRETEKNSQKAQSKIRLIRWIPYEGQKKFGDQYRNKVLKGVVDQVISGSTIRVELKTGNQFSNVVVNIAGVNAPKIVPPGGFTKKNRQGKDWSESDKLNQRLSKAFGIKSREWTEERLLGQYVGVKILFVSNGQIFAQINHDKGRIGPSLLKKGLAQYESWSANLCDREEQQTLKSAADFAIKNNLQICNFIKNQGKRFDKFEKKVTVIQVISGDTVLVEEQGKGNQINQVRYTLSSIRAPILRYRTPANGKSPSKGSPSTGNSGGGNSAANNDAAGDKRKGRQRGGKNRRGAGQNKSQSPSKNKMEWEVHPDEYLAREAKEFVRKNCIGKQVTLRYEYSRDIDTRTMRGKQDKKTKQFATIFFTNDKGKQENLALALIKKGLVDLIVHGKAETNRSEEYWKLEEAWNNARSKKPHPPGLFQYLRTEKGGFVRPDKTRREQEAAKSAIQDYSGVDDASIKTHDLIRLNQFLKGNKVRGVVEFIFGGNRVKVYIPQRKVCIAVRLADIRVGDWNLSGPNVHDPLRDRAKKLLEKTILQRDIEVMVTSTGQEMNQQRQGGRRKKQTGQGGTVGSRNPNLDGHIYINGKNISEELLSQGLATVIRRRYESDRTSTPANFKVLEQVAKKNKVGFWENYSDEGYGGRDDSKQNQEQQKQRLKASMTGKEVEVVVSHIETASLFYVNDANSDAMHKMNQEMAKLKASKPKPPKQIRSGKAVRFAAKYDGHYARCRVNNRADNRNKQQNDDQNTGKSGKSKGGKNDRGDQESSYWFVLFIDYGNKGRIPRTNFAELPAELRIDKIPPLAMRCELAGISVYEKNQAAFNAAGYYFSEYVFQRENQKLKMKILYDDQYSKTWYVDLYVGDKSINQLIAREGFVTMTKDRDLPREFANQQEHGKEWDADHKSYVKQYFDAIKENIRLAKDDHKNIWYHGDVDSADDDDNFPDNLGSKKGGGKRGR